MHQQLDQQQHQKQHAQHHHPQPHGQPHHQHWQQRQLHGSVLLVLLLFMASPDQHRVHAKPVFGMDKLVALAKPFVSSPQRHGGAPVRERLPVIYLQANALDGDKTTSDIHKSITLLLHSVAPHTPLDIFIFVDAAKAPTDPAVHSWTAVSPDIAMLPILVEHWHRRHHEYFLRDGHQDTSDIHLAGQWRLEVPFTLCAQLGYEYVLLTDSDARITEPYTVNMLTRLRAGPYLMGGHRVLQEPPHFFTGLPELARSFIVMHDHYLYDQSLQPEEKYRTSSALWQHCKPHDINGLHSMANDTLSGYDNSYLLGNFLIIQTELWMKPLVQDFVQLCLVSGGVYRFRWLDQSVLAFVWLMFVEPSHFLMFEDLKFETKSNTPAVFFSAF